MHRPRPNSVAALIGLTAISGVGAALVAVLLAGRLPEPVIIVFVIVAASIFGWRRTPMTPARSAPVINSPLCHDAAMASSRSILLVHGAWHGAWCWAALQAELDRRGVPSHAVDLPGHGASALAGGDLYGDSDHVGTIAARLAQDDRELVLVGHSYGGAVISQATERTANIAHLVYLTAYCLDKGEAVLPKTRSMPSVATELSNGTVRILDDGSGSTIDPERAAAALYGCCPPMVAAANIARLCVQPTATLTQPVTVAPWTTIPSTYVRCLRDEAIPISHQDVMAVHCGSILTIDTDHSPFASAVAETADIVESLARE